MVLWPVTRSRCCATPATILFRTILFPKGNPCPRSAVTFCGPSAAHCRSSALVLCGFACSRHFRLGASSTVGLQGSSLLLCVLDSILFHVCQVGICTSLFPFICQCTCGLSPPLAIVNSAAVSKCVKFPWNTWLVFAWEWYCWLCDSFVPNFLRFYF